MAFHNIMFIQSHIAAVYSYFWTSVCILNSFYLLAVSVQCRCCFI